MQKKSPRGDLSAIFTAALRRVDPYAMIKERVALDGSLLSVRADKENLEWDLGRYNRIFLIGAGKASAKMALGLEEILNDRISESVIAVKPGHTENLKHINMIPAGHPVPDAGSVEAGKAVADLCRRADEKTLIISLISGGGSALLSVPYAWKDGEGLHSLTLEDKQETTRALLSCGADIREINCIRKHLSLIKGGRLAALAAPAVTVNLILSDVPGDRLDAVASGLFVPDDSTYGEAAGVIEKYGLDRLRPAGGGGRLPDAVIKAIRLGAEGKLGETPKRGDHAFDSVKNILIGSNYGALLAAEEKARGLGYGTLVLSSEITGEAREAAKFYMGIARGVLKHDLAVKKPACVVAGGETTVTLRGGGKGGRNQEMALAFLAEIEADPASSEGISFLAASTDGNDGPTDAAGAFADTEILASGRAAGLSVPAYLAENDSYHYFDRLGYLFKTGATNTNVCDVQIMIIREPETSG
ncbi:MAG: glycerate kinase [Treponema sp.]|jgi:hydroxypyruvate reductase|nr:glycerate kinase [Treponema sp.]